MGSRGDPNGGRGAGAPPAPALHRRDPWHVRRPEPQPSRLRPGQPGLRVHRVSAPRRAFPGTLATTERDQTCFQCDEYRVVTRLHRNLQCFLFASLGKFEQHITRRF